MSNKTQYFRLAGVTAALVAAGLIASPMAFASSHTYTFAQGSIAGALQISQDVAVTSGSEDPNSATIKDNTLEGAHGNIGANEAAGSNNSQANVTALNRGNGGSRFAFTGALVSQDIDNLMYGQEGGSTNSNHATITDNALYGAHGNMGVNAAAGGGNQQANVLATVSGVSGFTMAGTMVNQSSTASATGELEGSNSTTMNGNAMQDTTGNMGINLATGQGNQQGNAAALAKTANFVYKRRHHSHTANKETESYGIVDQDLNSNTESDSNTNLELNGNNTTSISGNALRGATGNVGLNAVAGQSNQQANALVVNNGAKGESEGLGMVFQHNLGNGSHEDSSTNSASLSGDALRKATGNVGANVASGRFNQQANATMVAKSDHSFVFGQGNVSVQGNIGVHTDNESRNSATMRNSVLRGASGNLSVNVVAGTANSQNNGMQVVKAQSLAGVAAGGAVQYQVCNHSYNDGTNTVSMGDNVLRGATGNIGVNMAAGSSNLQSNVMTIATLK